MDNSFLHSKKLLLVDDEPELLKMVTAILEDDGFQHLVTAANVKEGLAAAKLEKPDCAILDVMLPDGDGFSLMQQIREWADIMVWDCLPKSCGSWKKSRITWRAPMNGLTCDMGWDFCWCGRLWSVMAVR